MVEIPIEWMVSQILKVALSRIYSLPNLTSNLSDLIVGRASEKINS